MKKGKSNLFSRRLRRRSGDTGELVAQLAPLEQLAPKHAEKTGSTVAAHENGAIVVGLHRPRLREDVVDESYQQTILGLEPVVIAIVGLLLAFILFITWLISRMPAE